MAEIWHPIVGFEGYEVSDQGNVRHWRRTCEWKTLKAWAEHKGYLRVGLASGGYAKKVFVHRLVVLAFIGPIGADHQINHKDGVKTHNWVSNLEVVTNLENYIHAKSIGLMACQKRYKLDMDKAGEIRHKYVRGIYDSHRLAREYGVHPSTILDVIHGVSWCS
jgi:hypothetical protein